MKRVLSESSLLTYMYGTENSNNNYSHIGHILRTLLDYLTDQLHNPMNQWISMLQSHSSKE